MIHTCGFLSPPHFAATMLACQVTHISDLIVQWGKMVNKIQIQYEQLKQEKGMIEAAVFEARVEKLQARTEKVLDKMIAGWLSCVG